MFVCIMTDLLEIWNPSVRIFHKQLLTFITYPAVLSFLDYIIDKFRPCMVVTKSMY